MHAIIRKCDHTGDSVLCEYETGDERSVEVAQKALGEFLHDCVERYGTKPPVWARRHGQTDFDPFNLGRDDLALVDQIICQFPMVGG